jgi:hypothetical protein
VDMRCRTAGKRLAFGISTCPRSRRLKTLVFETVW